MEKMPLMGTAEQRERASQWRWGANLKLPWLREFLETIPEPEIRRMLYDVDYAIMMFAGRPPTAEEEESYAAKMLVDTAALFEGASRGIELIRRTVARADKEELIDIFMRFKSMISYDELEDVLSEHLWERGYHDADLVDISRLLKFDEAYHR